MIKNKLLSDIYSENGFCITPFLSEEKCQQLYSLFNENVGQKNTEGLYANHNINQAEKGKYISEKIRDIVQGDLDEHFENYHYYIGHYMVKAPQTKGEFALHQDWNIVEERKHECFQIWIPLQMVDRQNGCLFFVPKSHNIFENFRSGSFGIPKIPTDDIVKPYIVDAIVPAGTAFIYSNGLFHGSYPNLTEQHRLSVIINIVEKTAPIYYFNLNKKEPCVECYSMTNENILTHLSDLEKGIIPTEMHLDKKIRPDKIIDNSAINSDVFVRQLKAVHGEHLNFKNKFTYNVVKNNGIEDKLNAEGFIQLPFLNENEIQHVKDVFSASFNLTDYDKPRFTSLEDSDWVSRKLVFEKLKIVLEDKLNGFFENYKIPILQFFVKMPNSDGDIEFHTDSSLFLNPHLEPNYGIWIPMEDVDESNGTLVVIPGSHLWYNGILTNTVQWPFYEYLDLINKKAVPLKIKAGEIVIFDSRMIHSSSFNSTGKARICVAGRVTHSLSQYYSFYKTKSSNRIKVFKEPDEFYFNEKWSGRNEVSETGVSIGEMSPPPLNPSLILSDE